jgi:hypothetical protein
MMEQKALGPVNLYASDWQILSFARNPAREVHFDSL